MSPTISVPAAPASKAGYQSALIRILRSKHACRWIGHAKGPLEKIAPSGVAGGGDVFVAFEDPIREPVVLHKLPDVLGGVQFGRARRQVWFRGTTGARDWH